MTPEGLQVHQGHDAQEAPVAGCVARKDWRAGPRYEMMRKLGSGSYGCVFEARDTQTGETVAVKRVELVDEPVHFRRTLREVSMLGMLRDNESIVKLLDIVAPLKNGLFDEIYLVMERCRSDLRKFCRSECTLSPIQARRVMYTTVRGIAYLHSGGIWHRDLKPENCLINPSCDVKIADFGLSRAVGWCDLGSGRANNLPAGDSCTAGEPGIEGAGVRFRKRPQVDLTTQVCTRWYRAPELLLSHSDYTEAIDIWSMGCIFAELLQCLCGSEHKKLRGPLFPGDYCRRPGYDTAMAVEQVPTPCRRPTHDMLDLVFQVIGTPSDADMARLRSESDRRHLRGFPPRRGCGVQARVPEADEEATEVLQQMLRFSAADRVTVCELLEHRLFSQVREQAGEKLAPGVLKLQFEEEPDDVKSLEPYLVREVHRYQKLS